MKDLLTKIQDVLKQENLRMAVSPLEQRSISVPLQDLTYSIDIQTSNANKYNDKLRMRLSHDVKISFIKQHGLDASKAQVDAFDLEEKIIKKLLTVTEFPIYRIFYVNSERTLNFSSEYILTNVIFNIESDFEIG